MGFFDEDPFEDILREFFGDSPVRRRHREAVIKGEREDRVIDFIEDNGWVYPVFLLALISSSLFLTETMTSFSL